MFVDSKEVNSVRDPALALADEQEVVVVEQPSKTPEEEAPVQVQSQQVLLNEES